MPRIAQVLLLALVPAALRPPPAAHAQRFEVSFPAAAHARPITGRVYVAVSRLADSTKGTPVEQTGETGAPLFGADVSALAPGARAAIDAQAFGHPLRSLRDLPAGEYLVQPFVNVYTRFARADGKTVWLHMDQWEGQNWKRSPGNLYGTPTRVRWDPKSPAPVRLVADKVIPAIQPPADDAHIKRIRIKSEILSKWWGQPIYFGATVLLPKGFAEHPDARYPVVYEHGHFSLRAPGGYGRDTAFTRWWDADGTPRMLLVTLQHPSPYYDDSYGVNSENNGPYGDAITQELLPEVERRFRAIGQPWARLLTGGSTGGWISLAHQVFYPEMYGGTWSLCPDAVDFRYHQIVNVYDDPNAYWLDMGWTRVPRPTRRRPDGNVLATMADENWFERAVGDRTRSGGQWDIWEATYGPVGADGYPQRIWDKTTGTIDKSVATYWKSHYDLRERLQSNWATLGPKLADKLNVYIGEDDSYYLDDASHLLHDYLKTTSNPKWTGEFVFQPGAPHCWGPPRSELLTKMAAAATRNAPAGGDTRSWRY